MFDHTQLPVELWDAILFAVIDMPFVLDTLINPFGCYWLSQGVYHDRETYRTSERQRIVLQAVCRSWRDWASRQNYRWIDYKWHSEDPVDVQESITALSVDNGTPQSEEDKYANLPRRVSFRLQDTQLEFDRDLYQNLLISRGFKVTTLYLACQAVHADEMFYALVEQAPNLPNLRCLVLEPPKSHLTPLTAISSAFPSLCTLTMKYTSSGEARGPDLWKQTSPERVQFEDMEELDIDIFRFSKETIASWHLPSMIHLHTPIFDQAAVPNLEIAFEPLKVLGANLIVLDLFLYDRRTLLQVLPHDFWSWLPRLKELAAFFSFILFETPAPVNHPLRYLIHWAYPQHDLSTGHHVLQAFSTRESFIIQNLTRVPPGVELFHVSKDWAIYGNVERTGLQSSARRAILEGIQNICSLRNIRVEDKSSQELASFLQSQALDG